MRQPILTLVCPVRKICLMAAGGGQQDPGGNYWAQREAEVGKAKAFAEQSAQNQKINDGVTSFGKMGIGGILSAITGGNSG